jgi:PKD repeat protein
MADPYPTQAPPAGYHWWLNIYSGKWYAELNGSGISYTVTPNGSVPSGLSTGGVATDHGGNPGQTVVPIIADPPGYRAPNPPIPQPVPPPNVTFTVQYLADGLSVKLSLVGPTPRSVSWAWGGIGVYDTIFNSGTGTGLSVIFRFPRAATYQVSMEAQYAAGQSLAIVFQTVTVAGSPVIPVASFTSTVDGLAVQFTNTSNFAAGSVSWDFGDGGVFSGQEVIHVYDEPGTYTVTMTADSLIATNTVTVALMTGFGPVFWTELINAQTYSGYGGVTDNLEGTSGAGTNAGSAKSAQTINEADVGSGVRSFLSGSVVSSVHGNHTSYFGLTNTDTLPSPSSIAYAINFYQNFDNFNDYAYVVESGVVVQALDPAIIASIGVTNIYFSVTINASGQVEYRYGTVTWNAGNFVSYGPTTLWYTSTVAPSFPLFAAASLSYASWPV